MTILPWLIPFFSPKKVVGCFLRKVNIGISYAPTHLAILTWNITIDDGVHSWACPAVSPRSAGFACPVSLYRAKAILPTRAERGQEPTVRFDEVMRQVRAQTTNACNDAYGAETPNQLPEHEHCSNGHHLRRLGAWAFPTPNHASTATDADDDDDGSISAFDMAHESRDDEDIAS
jgi:hypothetical protein